MQPKAVEILPQFHQKTYFNAAQFIVNDIQKGSMGKEDGRVAKTFLKARERREIEKNKTLSVPSSPTLKKIKRKQSSVKGREEEIDYNGDPRQYTKSVLQQCGALRKPSQKVTTISQKSCMLSTQFAGNSMMQQSPLFQKSTILSQPDRTRFKRDRSPKANTSMGFYKENKRIELSF